MQVVVIFALSHCTKYCARLTLESIKADHPRLAQRLRFAEINFSSQYFDAIEGGVFGFCSIMWGVSVFLALVVKEHTLWWLFTHGTLMCCEAVSGAYLLFASLIYIMPTAVERIKGLFGEE